MKKLILALLFGISLIASPIKFKESRYIEATGKTINLKGDIEFSKEFITIRYVEPAKKTMRATASTLTVENEKGEKETIDLVKNKHFGFYFSIFRSINEKNADSFKEFFEVIKTQSGYKLSPKNELKKSILQIAVKTENEKPKNIKIELTNGDKIEIDAEN